MAPLLEFMFLLLVVSGGMTRSVDHNENAVTTVSGTLYALEPFSDVPQQRLERRHVDVMNNSHVQTFRLDLGPEVAALEMELSQDSVWTDDSQVVVRRGEQVEEFLDAVDSSCFLSGRLTSHRGAASLNRCGRLSGVIQTGDYHYEIEELDDNPDSELSDVKVTMRRSKEMMSSEDGVIITDEDLLGRADDEEENAKSLTRRQSNGIAAEVAAFLDANFVNYMSRHRGKKTVAALTQWLVMKWNVIRNIFSTTKHVGVPFTIMLKKVEVWKTNPSYYARLGNRARTTNYLETFCKKSSDSPNYDHKMLYTQGTGEFHLGMAFLNGVCRSKRKCSLVKATDDNVKIELHEFGHNLGFEHDPDLEPCRDPQGDGGFMGWGSNYRFLDCYRRDLLKHIKEPGARCLYERNVNLDTLNPTSNAQRKTQNRKKQRNKNRKNRKGKNRN